MEPELKLNDFGSATHHFIQFSWYCPFTYSCFICLYFISGHNWGQQGESSWNIQICLLCTRKKSSLNHISSFKSKKGKNCSCFSSKMVHLEPPSFIPKWERWSRKRRHFIFSFVDQQTTQSQYFVEKQLIGSTVVFFSLILILWDPTGEYLGMLNAHFLRLFFWKNKS